MAGVLNDLRNDVAKEAGERGERGELFICEKMSKEWVRRMEDSHPKADIANVTVGVIIVVEDVLGSFK